VGRGQVALRKARAQRRPAPEGEGEAAGRKGSGSGQMAGGAPWGYSELSVEEQRRCILWGRSRRREEKLRVLEGHAALLSKDLALGFHALLARLPPPEPHPHYILAAPGGGAWRESDGERMERGGRRGEEGAGALHSGGGRLRQRLQGKPDGEPTVVTLAPPQLVFSPT
jgi:hypothetical protein